MTERTFSYEYVAKVPAPEGAKRLDVWVPLPIEEVRDHDGAGLIPDDWDDPKGETLVDLLLAPGRAHPTSIFAQLEYIDRAWGEALGLDQLSLWRRMAWTQDLRVEDEKWFQRGGPGPGTAAR